METKRTKAQKYEVCGVGKNGLGTSFYAKDLLTALKFAKKDWYSSEYIAYNIYTDGEFYDVLFLWDDKLEEVLCKIKATI